MVLRGLLRLIFGAALLLSMASQAYAALITFNDRGLFNGAAPGLPVETFEAGLVSAGGVTTCNGPLSSATATPCFASGALLPGIEYSASLGPSIAILGAGVVQNASKVLGPNLFSDTLNVTFASANAIGLDVLAGPVAGNVVVRVFSPGAQLLETFTVATPLGGTFFGIVSDTGPIGSLNIASLASIPGELIDNVAFGTTTSAVPEPASIVLLGLGVASVAARRRRRSAH